MEIRRASYLDNAGLVALYRSLDARSSELRFSRAMSEEDLAEQARLGPDDGAVVALEGREVVGEARYVVAPAGPPELAITVAPAAQGHGVGKVLLKALRDIARAEGVLTLRGIVRTDNMAMVRLLRQVATLVNAPTTQGDLVFDLACDDLMAPWPRSSRRPKVLVESPEGLDPEQLREIVDAGVEVRQCVGPSALEHRRCPALVHGTCRLADGADLVVSLLPQDLVSEQLMEAHRGRHGDRLFSSAEAWQDAARRLLGR